MAFDEQGQADTVERKVAIAKRAYRLLTDAGRASRPRTSSSTRTSLPSAPGSRSTPATGSRSSRRPAGSRRSCPTRSVSGGISNVSFSFRGNDPVREAIHAVFLYHAIRAGLDMGIVNAGQLPLYDDIPPTCASGWRTSSSTAAPDATERLLAVAAGVAGQAVPPGPTSPGATGRCTSGWSTRWCEGIDRLDRGGHRGGAAAGGAPARRDRRAADGRDERGGRPLRRRQDVPAAGGQERPGHEARGGVPDPVHRSGQGARRRPAPRARSCWPPSRATCTTSARTSWASCCSATTST